MFIYRGRPRLFFDDFRMLKKSKSNKSHLSRKWGFNQVYVGSFSLHQTLVMAKWHFFSLPSGVKA